MGSSAGHWVVRLVPLHADAGEVALQPGWEPFGVQDSVTHLRLYVRKWVPDLGVFDPVPAPVVEAASDAIAARLRSLAEQAPEGEKAKLLDLAAQRERREK